MKIFFVVDDRRASSRPRGELRQGKHHQTGLTLCLVLKSAGDGVSGNETLEKRDPLKPLVNPLK